MQGGRGAVNGRDQMAENARDDTSLVDGYQAVTLATQRGEVRCRYYAADETKRGVVWIGGVGGGWDTPARDLYPRLAAELTGEEVLGLRVRFRHPGEMEDCVFDVCAGLAYLQKRGAKKLAVVGHSFGGAVAIQAAARMPAVTAVVALAPQSHGGDLAATLGPRCALLLVHGKDDEILPPTCSEHLHAIAVEPKKFLLFSGARHVLDEVADRVHREIRNWLLTYLE